MLAVERRILIVNMLQEKKKVLVSDLTKILKVSDETVRKDLKELENNDILIRSHGGAILKDNNMQPSFLLRETFNYEAKQQIAQAAQDYIEDGMILMVDTSTTNKLVVQNISPKKNVTIITNSYQLINECSILNHLKFIATGGEVSNHFRSYIGRDCIKTLRGYNADLSLIGGSAIHLSRGLMDTAEGEIDVKQAMVEYSRTTLSVLDHSKFDCILPYCTINLSDIDYLVTDKALDETWLNACKEHNIQSKVITIQSKA